MSKAQYFDNTGIDELPDDWRHYCQLKRPDLDPDELFEEFTDYWISAAGQNARKRNWLATWRNWCRRARATKSQQVSWQDYAHQNRLDARPGESEYQWKARVESHMRARH